MAEVDVGYDKRAIHIEQPSYFSEFLGLEASSVFEKTLRKDDIEVFFTEPDRSFKEVGFNQIRRSRVVYSYIDTIVFYVRIKQTHQGRRSATNVKKGAFSSSGELIYNSRGFF